MADIKFQSACWGECGKIFGNQQETKEVRKREEKIEECLSFLITINGEILMYNTLLTWSPSFMIVLLRKREKNRMRKIYILEPSFFNLTENTDALNSLNFHSAD